MPLTYRGLPLQVVYTRECSREAVRSRDGCAYELTRWVLDFDCIYNNRATSYAQVGIDNTLLPVARAGLPAPTTDIALRDWLFQDRGTLVYTIGTQTLLSLPAPGYTTDALNGPTVERCDVREILGDRTLRVSIRIVAHTNEGPRINAAHHGINLTFRVLLSNRWRRWVEQDDQYFVAVVTEGVAKFRVDELAKRGDVADNYRGAVLPPVPRRFARDSETVSPSEDGAELHYRVVDRELAFSTPTVYGATRVEAYESRTYTLPSVLNAVVGGLAQTIPTMVSFANSKGFSKISRMAKTGSLASIGAQGALSIIGQSLPVMTGQVTCKAWGHRGTTRFLLASLATGICYARLGLPGGVEKTTTITLVQEVTGKYVEFSMTFVQCYLPGVPQLAADGTILQQPSDYVLRLPRRDDTVPFLLDVDRDNVSPPNSSGTRGSWLGQIAAAPSPSPHADPPAWPDVNTQNTDQVPP